MVQNALADPSVIVFVSAASAYEIVLKNRTGKLPNVEELIDGFDRMLTASGFQQLDVTAGHAIRAGRLDLRHKDLFARLLIAQALVEDLELVSNERLFDSFDIRRFW